MWTGALTALFAAVSALAQTDAKRLLAFSSVSQMGYILAVFGAGSPTAFAAVFYHAINHALFKSLLFLTVGMAVKVTGERNLYRIRPLGSTYPVFAAAFFTGALSIAGIPAVQWFCQQSLHLPGYEVFQRLSTDMDNQLSYNCQFYKTLTYLHAIRSFRHSERCPYKEWCSNTTSWIYGVFVRGFACAAVLNHRSLRFPNRGTAP